MLNFFKANVNGLLDIARRTYNELLEDIEGFLIYSNLVWFILFYFYFLCRMRSSN